MNEKWREGQLPGMSAYVLAADIFDIWAYLAENSESAADRVEQAIYDAARFSGRPVARPYQARPHGAFTSFLAADPLSQLHLHRCLPAKDGPASNHCGPPRKTQYPAHPEAAPVILVGESD
jgi:hypothetical protein